MYSSNIAVLFKVFPDGFPDELINELEQRTGRQIIGNKPASGTAILDELGQKHMNTGALMSILQRIQ
ncbi:hypothetical protein GCM10008013_03510 [Paenibacillus segetis]|uniref:Uncharacterized protein n=1 Tax=Paenibacillus segetis TaxID=1325360 RepID=A0ABQ1Y3T1_9BACL|nr:hypothetical protein GCM10008013_03510 [Paenibacillus segetis]